jgi:hypothetical protein
MQVPAGRQNRPNTHAMSKSLPCCQQQKKYSCCNKPLLLVSSQPTLKAHCTYHNPKHPTTPKHQVLSETLRTQGRALGPVLGQARYICSTRCTMCGISTLEPESCNACRKAPVQALLHGSQHTVQTATCTQHADTCHWPSADLAYIRYAAIDSTVCPTCHSRQQPCLPALAIAPAQHR